MTAPDHQGYTRPGESDDLPVTLLSKYTDDTIPNPRCTNLDEAVSITLKHILEFIDADTEDPEVRYAALTVDLGFRPVGPEFWRLVDDYRAPCTPEYADRYETTLRDWLQQNGVKP